MQGQSCFQLDHESSLLERMRFFDSVQDSEGHCLSLILSVGGPACKAADKLEREWTVQVLIQMQIDFAITKPPQQPEDRLLLTVQMFSPFHVTT